MTARPSLNAYGAPAARGATAYYADPQGVGFICTRFAGFNVRIGESFGQYRVVGVVEAVEGIPVRGLGYEVEVVDGLPVARYLPVVSKPSPAQVAALAMAAE